MSDNNHVISKKDYPMNLAWKALQPSASSVPNGKYSFVMPERLIWVLHEVCTEREVKVIELRYIHNYTYREIGIEIGVGVERVRQILAKIHRKLVHVNVKKKFMWCWDVKKFDEITIKLSELETGEKPLADILLSMELSVRPYNCLARAGYHTIKDFDKLPVETLAKIRNMGAKSLCEILNKTTEMGFVLRKCDTGDLVHYVPLKGQSITKEHIAYNCYLSWERSKEDGTDAD